jgi:precorrin-3B methylase
MPFELPGAPKPGIDRLLIESALQPDLRRRLVDSPEEVFPEFDLTEEQRDILRKRDDRLLELLGAALARQAAAGPPAPPAPQPSPPAPQARQLPDLRLALTVVPVAQEQAGKLHSLSFAAWVNPLPEGTDPAGLAPPEGTVLPGQPLAPLRAVVHVCAQLLADAGGGPQVGLTASLLQSSNLAAPPVAAAAGRPGGTEDDAAAPDIWIAGLGVATTVQVTREVEQAVRASREVLYLDTGVATREYLEGLCPRVTSLYEETYFEERWRETGYERTAARVIEAALDHAPVTFAIHGHPLIAAHPPFLAMERARAAGLRVRVLPGVSAIDTILADLRLDPVVHGFQMYEATDLLLRRRPLQADVPALIWQIGPLETCLHTQRLSRPERFARFVAHLRLYYPPRHEVVAIYCSPHPLLPPTVLRFALEDMGRHAAQIHSGFSLYVPPTGSRPIEDHDLLSKLYSVEHLRSITGR